MQILDGKKAAQTIKDSLKLKIENLKPGSRKPCLAAILVGNNGASQTYVTSKIKNCGEVGFESRLISLEENCSEKELFDIIGELNNDEKIDGILVQLPLPAHISESKLIGLIDPEKDVDGFHPVNAGKLMLGEDGYIPATPFGVMLMLEHYGIETSGKHAVVIGRSNIVGRPMSVLLSQSGKFANCTVTLCHSKTKDLAAHTRQADIIIAAIGKAEFLTGDMVKEGVIVIDVGINRVEDKIKKSGYALKGDVHFDSVSKKSSWISPVPGGVGLMTIAALLTNTYKAFEKHQQSNG
jgi:methylenetetrahydrofolate dehydrogenase (NADP+)/methenyltetrahydrofolate cyclohydrolase